MSVIDSLSRYLEGVRAVELPAEVVNKTKLHILDTLGPMISGSKLKPGRLALRFARSQRGSRESTVVGSNLRVPAATASLVNGIFAHADETDDTHWGSRTHPGCAIIPAALAVAEKENRTGRDLVSAVVAGYDVGCRVTRALGINQTGWHSTHSIGGTFGAAAAASVLGGLNAQQIRWALSYAAQQASGVRAWVADSEHVEKAFDFGGMPARNGATAALLFQSGFTGMNDVLEGEKNFLGAYSPAPDPQQLISGLGDRYEILATSIKRFPVGAPIQAAAEALLLLRERRPLAANEVKQLTVRLPKDGAETVNNRHMPDINLQYIMAVMLIDGRLSFAAAHDLKRMNDRKILEMKTRIELLPDEGLLQADIPRQGIVELTTQSGESLREHVVSSRGTPQNPMSNEEVEEKARELTVPILGEERSRNVLKKLRALESLPSLRELVSLLRKSP